MIDWDRVTELKSEVGEDGFAEIGQIFIAEIEAKLAEIAGGDPEASDFHFLRGSAANLGLSEFAASCSTAEAQAKAGDPVDLADLAEIFALSLHEMGPAFDAA